MWRIDVEKLCVAIRHKIGYRVPHIYKLPPIYNNSVIFLYVKMKR